MPKNKILFIVLLMLLVYILPQNVFASENAYVTIINPIRTRSDWHNMTYLNDHIKFSLSKKLPTTWLVQYDVLKDAEIIKTLKVLPEDQEIGVLLEVSELMATTSNVPYVLGKGDWAKPNKVFFSGYSTKERKKMLDNLFEQFYETFGFYPQSVGAWYIDSFTLNYLVEKYHIQGALIVSDQYSTDAYKLWGQPWGVPFYPSKYNSLIPARSKDDMLDIVLMQWAPRDPMKGYGRGVKDSTYSLQANDYVGHHGLGIDYFTKLLSSYINSSNEINQATIGIEVGTESQFLPEYKKQLDVIKDLKEANIVNPVTVSQFTKEYKKKIKNTFPNSLIIGKDILDTNSENITLWFTTSLYRAGLSYENNELKLFDLRSYTNVGIIKDFISPDPSDFLDRTIPAVIDNLTLNNAEVLVTNIDSIQYSFDGEKFIIEINNKKNEPTKIELDNQNIILNNKKYWSTNQHVPSLKNNILLQLIRLENRLPNEESIRLGFSYINSNYYFGLIHYPSSFIGFISTPPYIGIFPFPFQALVRFQNIPQFDVYMSILSSLISSE